MTALIVDDEPHARQLLHRMLTQYVDGVEVLGTCANVAEARRAIDARAPDVLFLDVEMPQASGFELVAELSGQYSGHVVFVTAHADYALRAFEVPAVDYLLKPVSVQALERAVERVRATAPSGGGASAAAEPPSRIALPSRRGIDLLPVGQVVLFVADGSYTRVVLVDGSETLASKKIGLFDELLGERWGFFRAHRSYLVNLDLLEAYHRAEATLVMRGGHEARLARDRRVAFEEVLARIAL